MYPRSKEPSPPVLRVGMEAMGRVVMTLIAMVVVLAVDLCWWSGDGADCDGNGGSSRIVLRDW